MRNVRLFVSSALLLGVSVLVVGLPKPPLVYYREPPAIEAYLLRQTPHGTSLSEVQAFLRDHAVRTNTFYSGEIKAGSTYPPSSVPGKGSVKADLGQYRVFLVHSVEAFYIFGSRHELVDIRVRKTIDGL